MKLEYKIMKELLLRLIKDIENTGSELWDMDYGCDGRSEECCGSCGGNNLVSYMLVKRLNEIIKSSQ